MTNHEWPFGQAWRDIFSEAALSSCAEGPAGHRVYRLTMNSRACVFCQIIAGTVSAQIVWTNDHAIAFLDRAPMNPGHLLIVPRAHVETLWDLEESKFIELLLLVRRLAVPLIEALNAERAGVAVEGYGVSHAHVHLIPLNGGKELDPCRQFPAPEEELETIAQRIRVQFRKALH